MELNKITCFLGILIVTISLFVVGVNAIGAGGVPEYIEVYPGQDVERDLSLQNLPAGNGDLVFVGSVEEGSEYVSFLTNNIEVADGEIENIRIKTSVSETANIGDTYNIKLDLKSSSVVSEGADSEGAAVQFNLGTDVSFDVKVIEKPAGVEEEGISTIWWILGIVLIVIVITLIWFMNKSKKSIPAK